MKLKKEYLLSEKKLNEAWWSRKKPKENEEEKKQQELATAIIMKDYDKVKSLVKKETDPDPISLNWAISDGDSKMIDVLIQNGVTPTHENIRYAILTQNENMLPHVLKNGVTPSSDNLLLAIRARQPETVDLFVKSGVKIEKNPKILNNAIATGNVSIINNVLKLNPQSNYMSMVLALNHNNLELIKTLMSHGVMPSHDDFKRIKNNEKIDREIKNLIAKYAG